MFRKILEQVAAGKVKTLIGSRHAKLDNSYIDNLVHGYILAAEHLIPRAARRREPYFINDDDPVNVFEFARPVIEACGERWPRLRVLQAGWYTPPWLAITLAAAALLGFGFAAATDGAAGCRTALPYINRQLLFS